MWGLKSVILPLWGCKSQRRRLLLLSLSDSGTWSSFCVVKIFLPRLIACLKRLAGTKWMLLMPNPLFFWTVNDARSTTEFGSSRDWLILATVWTVTAWSNSRNVPKHKTISGKPMNITACSFFRQPHLNHFESVLAPPSMVCPSCSTLSQAYWQARTIFHFQLVTNDRSRTIKLCKACSLEKWEIFWVFLEESPDKKDIPSMPCKSVRSEGSLRKNYNCDQLRRADSCNWASAIIILQIIETNIWQIWRCSTTTNTNLQIQTRSLKRGRRGARVTTTRRELPSPAIQPVGNDQLVRCTSTWQLVYQSAGPRQSSL